MGCIKARWVVAGLTDRAWLELVKATRAKFGVSINEAHRLILADETMRRLIALRVNRDRQCRKLALADWRQNGPQSLFSWDGEALRLREHP